MNDDFFDTAVRVWWQHHPGDPWGMFITLPETLHHQGGSFWSLPGGSIYEKLAPVLQLLTPTPMHPADEDGALLYELTVEEYKAVIGGGS